MSDTSETALNTEADSSTSAPQDTLVACARRLWNGPRAAHAIEDRRLRALARTIEENPDDWNSIRRGIDATRLSQAYLSVRFKEAAGLPMRSFALWMKFEQACRLVLEGTSAGDAALEAGFADQSHMGRAARRFAKKSFRRAILELESAIRAESTQLERAPESAVRDTQAMSVAPVSAGSLQHLSTHPYRVAS